MEHKDLIMDKELLSFFEKIIFESKDDNLKALAKKAYISVAKDIVKIEKTNIKLYKDRLISLEKKKENSETSDELKIVSVKKSNFESTDLKILSFIEKNMNIIPSSILCFMISKVYKKTRLNNDDIISYLVEQGYIINGDNKLESAVTESVFEKAKASFYKKILSKISNFSDVSLIPKGYKKDKILSILLNMSNVRSLRTYFKLPSNEATVSKSENVDIRKGMGKC